MINTYEAMKNPCVLCVDTINSDSVNVKKDYLEFSLDGKGATLIIREKSVEDIKHPQEEENKEPEKAPDDDTVYTPSRISHSEQPFNQTSPRTEADQFIEVGPHSSLGRQTGLHALYTKKWSGKTYFEEELRKFRLKEYTREVNIAESKRNVWKQFQKEMQKNKRHDLIKSGGPEWWQEPSRKQICLVASLGDVIRADNEEGVTGRTRQWLLDLGVTTKVTPGQVKSCMRRCLLDPVDFLLDIHSVILKSQGKKKKGELEKPFSVNERLLLSAVCVLHLPVLLTMLHFILPPPKPFSKAKHIQEILFGDLEDERIRYSTPYMEPLPFRSKTHYHSWALDRVFMALLPSLVLDEFGNKMASLDTTGRAISSVVQSIVAKKNDEEESVFRNTIGSSASVTELISHCVSTRKDTLRSHTDDSSETKTSFSRQLSAQTPQVKPNKLSYQPRFEGGSGYFVVESTYVVRTVELSDKTNTVDIADTNLPVQNDGNILNQSQLDSKPIAPISTDDPGRSSVVNSITTYSQETEEPQHRPTSLDMRDSDLTDELKFSFEEFQDLEHRELNKLWEEIKILPRHKQLRRALNILSDLGDPLAQLPNLHKLPTVQRWLEIRRGKRRILSQEDKQNLLRTSRGMWKAALASNSTKGPKLDIPKREERLLTWDSKKWLNSRVTSELENYNSRLKQEKVENARHFFPAMLNHYDYGSKLNRNFRDLYFTYFPAREADTFTYKPWQPNETRNSKAV